MRRPPVTLAAALVAALCVGAAGCSAASGADGTAGAANEGGSAAVAVQEPEQEQPAEDKPVGRMVATYDGAKCIVSSTDVSEAAEGAEPGLREACIVDASSLSAQASSIEWGRNSITLRQVPLEQGSVTYRFAYVNEADLSQDAEAGIATEDAYFASLGLDGAEHVDVEGHDVAYAVRVRSEAEGADAIPDLEAQAEGPDAADASVGGAGDVTVYAFEARGEGCALTTTVTMDGTSDAAAVDAGQAVREAYALLSFAQESDELDAASHMADLVICGADDAAQWTVARGGRELLLYEPHRVVLLDPVGSGVTETITYDFLASTAAPEGTPTYDVDGHTVRASVDGSALRAWVDVDGSTLLVEAAVRNGEDVEVALARILGD